MQRHSIPKYARKERTLKCVSYHTPGTDSFEEYRSIASRDLRDEQCWKPKNKRHMLSILQVILQLRTRFSPGVRCVTLAVGRSAASSQPPFLAQL